MIKAVRTPRADEPESLAWTLPTRGGAEGPELQPLLLSWESPNAPSPEAHPRSRGSSRLTALLWACLGHSGRTNSDTT